LLFGKPEGVFAEIRNQRDGAKVDDSFDVMLLYPGMKAILKGSYLIREPGPRFKINGTEGTYVKSGADPQEAALMAGHMPDEPGWGKEPEENWGILNTTLNGMHYRGKIETESGSYMDFYNDIYDAIKEGKKIPVKPEESLEGIRVIKAAFESSREKKVIKL
jgi:predicted dehydrogenase